MRQSFLYRGNQVSYTILGNGVESIMLIHGFGEDGEIWLHQIEELSKHYTIIIPDLPGSGLSAYNGALESIEDFAEVLKALMDDANLNETVMLGHSMGGYITLAFAEKYAEKLKGFGLIHSTAFADSEEKKGVRLRGIEAIEQYGAFAFLKNTIPNLFGAEFKMDHKQQVDELIARSAQFSISALRQYYTIMMQRKDRCAVLQKSSIPILFVIGSEDIASPPTDVFKQVHLPHNSQVVFYESTGHMGMWEQPMELLKTIESFMLNIAVLP